MNSEHVIPFSAQFPECNKMKTHQLARVEILASDFFTPSSSSSEVRSDTI